MERPSIVTVTGRTIKPADPEYQSSPKKNTPEVARIKQALQTKGCATCKAMDHPYNCSGSTDAAFGANCTGYFR